MYVTEKVWELWGPITPDDVSFLSSFIEEWDFHLDEHVTYRGYRNQIVESFDFSKYRLKLITTKEQDEMWLKLRFGDRLLLLVVRQEYR